MDVKITGRKFLTGFFFGHSKGTMAGLVVKFRNVNVRRVSWLAEQLSASQKPVTLFTYFAITFV
jgi:hypothetical protein